MIDPAARVSGVSATASVVTIGAAARRSAAAGAAESLGVVTGGAGVTGGAFASRAGAVAATVGEGVPALGRSRSVRISIAPNATTTAAAAAMSHHAVCGRATGRTVSCAGSWCGTGV